MSRHAMPPPGTDLARRPPYDRAPPALQWRIRKALRSADRPERVAAWTRGFALAATRAAGSIASWNGALLPSTSPAGERAAPGGATAHIRSLLGAAHLTDARSTDPHTPKPWLSGQLGSAPP